LTGAGKSSLINGLIVKYRERGSTVGVIAEDPTSPFTGGAILGDRIRMQDRTGDPGVFIRSIASRGSETGLSTCAAELADVLDAFGRDIILLETIGVGQLEHRIRFSALTSVVVLTPDAGDDVQGLKSGIMEIGEIFVVNKADRPKSDRFVQQLKSMLELRRTEGDWNPPVIPTVAREGRGIDDLLAAIDGHHKYIRNSGLLEQKRIDSLRNRIVTSAEHKLKEMFWGNQHTQNTIDRIFGEVQAGRMSPYEAARDLLAAFKKKISEGSSK
jgi:LAO/AO transport system kinase